MSLERSIVGIVPGLQATALLGYNLKQLELLGKPKKMHSFAPKKINMKKASGKMIKMGVTNLVGIGLIGATARAVGDIS